MSILKTPQEIIHDLKKTMSGHEIAKHVGCSPEFINKLAKGHITSLEAYQKLKVTQLAARITDLESAGFVFAKPCLKVGGCRQPVTHYSIIENGVEV